MNPKHSAPTSTHSLSVSSFKNQKWRESAVTRQHISTVRWKVCVISRKPVPINLEAAPAQSRRAAALFCAPRTRGRPRPVRPSVRSFPLPCDSKSPPTPPPSLHSAHFPSRNTSPTRLLVRKAENVEQAAFQPERKLQTRAKVASRGSAAQLSSRVAVAALSSCFYGSPRH